MHGELFRSRCEKDCGREDFVDREFYESAAKIPHCECGGRIRPHIVWFGEMPLHMDEILERLDRCTVLLVAGSSGTVHPAASFVQWAWKRKVRTYYLGPEKPLNAELFTQLILAKAGEALPSLFQVKI
jgi:NAD-dependent deacetylase